MRIEAFWRFDGRRVLTLLAAIMLAVFMTGCGEQAAPESRDEIVPTETVKTTPDVELLLTACRPEKRKLEVRWKNQGDRTVLWGEGFSLARWEEADWEPVDGPGVVPSIAYNLSPGQEAVHTYDLSTCAPLYPGTYRLETAFSFSGETGTYPLSFSFSVGRPIDGTYWFDSSLFVNPLCSFRPDARSMPEYRIRNGVLTAVDAAGERTLGTLRAKPLPDPALPGCEMTLSGHEVTIERPEDCFFYELEKKPGSTAYCLYDVSGTLWLAQMNREEVYILVSLRPAG